MWLLVLSSFFLLSCTVTAKQFSIIPSSNTGCPRDPCYTLTDVVQDPPLFFTSNTVITFLPGYHQTKTNRKPSVLIKDVRNISMVGYDPTNSDLKSVIQCTGSLGFAFVNVTALKIAKLMFSFCGAEFPSNDKLSTTQVSKVTLYFLQTINVTISEVVISNSTGAGLLGINMLGLSTISQTIFSGNKQNCLLIFLDIPTTLQIILPTVFNLVDLQITFESTQMQEHFRLQYATGLNIKLAQTTYKVRIYINNITNANTDIQSGRHSHLYITIENWMCHCSVIQAKQIATLNTAGSYDVLRILLLYGNSSLHTSTCQSEEDYMVHISESHFVGTRLWVESNQKYYCDAKIKLQNITIQNCTQLAALYIKRMLSIELQDMRFTYNHLRGVVASNSNITLYGSNFFTNNTGKYILLTVKTKIYFHGNTKFVGNKVIQEWGGTIFAVNSTIIFQQNFELVENEGRACGVISLYQTSHLVFWEQSKVTFLRNHAQRNGGAILADASTIVVQRDANITFMENAGYNGGALALQNGATITLASHSQMIFIRNHAQHNGGALYVNNIAQKIIYVSPFITCFFQTGNTISHRRLLLTSPPSLMFLNNTADNAGSSIYGGWVDLCWYEVFTPMFDDIFHFKDTLQQLSTISSNPTRVCVCINDLPDCNITRYNITAYPGETFQLPAVAVGQRFGTIPFTVHARFTSNSSSSPPQMKLLQGTQKVKGKCTDLTYNIFSRHQNERMILSVDKVGIPVTTMPTKVSKAVLLQFAELFVCIALHPCPLGFVLYNSSCTCHAQLQQHAINCSIDTQKVNRPSFMWINATFFNRVLVHEHCPFDYCQPDSFDLDLEDPDEQCAFHRSGILCGACQHNLSHVFGTSACRECSSMWALLWLPLIALAGIALVVLLIALNLSVSVGTINGLIFYANIVRANHATFFPPNTTNSFLSWFIAWINLDLGIETCFYNGLDAYVKTWLQFAFPLYIWFLVITIIVLSHYYTLAARLSGRNAVPVLATLFLLSYAKLLRIIITVFQSTELDYPDNSVKKVWLYDGNVDYLKGKHIPLFIAAMLLLLISLPYTAVLIFIQHLQRWSSYRVLFWVKKLKPLFDAYTGPYKDRHRYWTGLLLLIRIVLFLIFSMNIWGSAEINLLAIILTVLSLFIHGVVVSTVYKTWALNVIEHSYFLNLGILASATLFTTVTGQGQIGVSYTSVGITFTQFIITATFHALKRFRSSHHCNRTDGNIVRKLRNKVSKVRSALKKVFYKQKSPHHDTQRTVNHARVELRESLLEFCS